MLSMIETLSPSLAVIRLSGDSLGAVTFSLLQPVCTQLRDSGFRAVLIDASNLKRSTHGGLAGLVELFTVLGHGLTLGFCGLDDRGMNTLDAAGLSQALPLFKDVESALETERFRRESLTGLKAVILSAGSGSRMAPLTEEAPKPMLDVMGQPVLAHLANHLAAHGLRDLIINPGHLGEQIPAYFRENPRADQSLFFAVEGRRQNGAWQAEPLGSASTLARLNCDHAAFGGDTFVLCGDALIDLDLTAMLAEHRASGAGVTIAAQQVAPEEVHKYGIIAAGDDGRITGFQEKPSAAEAFSTLASTGIYIFRADVLQALQGERWMQKGLDIANDLLPALMQDGTRLQVFHAPFQWADMGNPNAYYASVSAALSGTGPAVTPNGEEHSPGVWVAPGAQVSPKARISGPCYIGADAVIEDGAVIVGPCMIGAGSHIEKRAVVRNSIIWQQTHVQNGAWVDHMIAAGNWAVDHRFAMDGSANRSPLDMVAPMGGQQVENAPITLVRAGATG